MATISRNELVLARNPGEYMNLRHIVLEGSNREIGQALGDIAKTDYGVAGFLPYASGVYAQAQRGYVERNYPILWERMQGVADSYGVTAGESAQDVSSLYYMLGRSGCSVVYFPGSSTTSEHSLVVRNMDFYTVSFPEFAGLGPVEGSPRMFSENYVLEVYPDDGYPSLALGSLDLFNGVMDGVNSQGLTVSYLADPTLEEAALKDLTRPVGLSANQMLRLLLDTCASVEEAKIALLINKLFMPIEGCHFLVADAAGHSTVAELSEKDFSMNFTDGGDKPQVMTNHSVFEYPDVASFPEYPAGARYNTFARYRVLDDYIAGHSGPFSNEDAEHALELVYADTEDSSEGAAHDFPVRTIWLCVTDTQDLTMRVKFYRRDEETDPATGIPTLGFTGHYEFSLKR